MNNNEKLIALMDEHNLTLRETAAILGVSYFTVRSWALPETSKARRICPNMAVELLELKLSALTDPR